MSLNVAKIDKNAIELSAAAIPPTYLLLMQNLTFVRKL